jgi:CRISPR-associated protein Cas1
MSYHILHITTPNVSLYCEKGFLFCRFDDDSENKIPVADLRAIIIATHQVTFTNSCLARLIENDIVILHCNNKYKPTGWSVGLDRVIRTKAFYNQIAQNEEFDNKLWKQIVKQKVLNQAGNLDLIGCKEHNLYKLIERPLPSEANIAKQYWARYFEALDSSASREKRNAETFENACLNYGYAVFLTLIYRSALVHGHCPNLGIHHKEKYESTPLLYDMIEPFRAFVDFYLYKFKVNFGGDYKREDHKSWCQYLAFCMKNYRLQAKGLRYKIIDFVDIYAEDIVNAFIEFDTAGVTMPDIKAQYLHIDKHKNREREEYEE